MMKLVERTIYKKSSDFCFFFFWKRSIEDLHDIIIGRPNKNILEPYLWSRMSIAS